MNPLTQIKNTQKATKAEIDLGISDKSSWHARFRHSAYVFAGGLPYELTEGDILAVFSQYGEIVDIHLVRDKQSGKSKGFAFLAYEDQRSTVLAVDNLSGARVAGRTIRVEHVDNYRKKRAEMEGEEPLPDSDDGEHFREHHGGRQRPYVNEKGEREGAAQQRSGDTPADEGAPWESGNSVFQMIAQARSQGFHHRPWASQEGNIREADDELKREAAKKHKKKHKHDKKKEKRRTRSRERGERQD